MSDIEIHEFDIPPLQPLRVSLSRGRTQWPGKASSTDAAGFDLVTAKIVPMKKRLFLLAVALALVLAGVVGCSETPTPPGADVGGSDGGLHWVFRSIRGDAFLS